MPSRIAGQPIYRCRLSLEDVERRVRLAYWPYHHALQRLLDEAQSQFGEVLLLDCHSMPSFAASGALCQEASDAGLIDIALGDRFGHSCAPAIIRLAETFLQGQGLRVMRNRPYAGGHITAHYGQPHLGMHALQIEIRRGLYMDESQLRPHGALEDLKGILTNLLLALAGLMRASVRPVAARALPAE
ncbi:MAG: N-formylglutamate amidohydrolase [Rhizobiales bacterium]|nr:N-formylglutamate amidohydrolase [Hyphomicrobiales bacterium]